ncbi:MAG TPA: hypothetical protein VFO46_19860 [Candidatus Sulfotelmatobacter sp.]|nr:hypothetical protein [Candidatus Sulfotelmatobacter sp.]
MEGLTRLVADSLARHGFDRPLDYRRLHWSRWFRCESLHSLLFVPSRPGVFALAEEIMDLDRPTTVLEGDSRKLEAEPRRMLAVTQFFEADDMAFVLDRMISRPNTMQARLASGRYFVRYVVIEDSSQRRTICSALNQWMVSAAEKVTGIGSHFASSLELTPATEYVPQSNEGRNLFEVATDAGSKDARVATAVPAVPRSEASAPGTRVGFSAPASNPTAPQLDSGAATNIHCPSPFPSGF